MADDMQYHVTTSIDGEVLSETPCADPFVRHTLNIAWQDMKKHVEIHTDMRVEVNVSGTAAAIKHVMRPIATDCSHIKHGMEFGHRLGYIRSGSGSLWGEPCDTETVGPEDEPPVLGKVAGGETPFAVPEYGPAV